MKRKKKKETKQKEKREKREWSIQDYVSLYLICGAFMYTFGKVSVVVSRLGSSLKDLALSIAYYFLYLLGFSDVITPTVTQLPEIPIKNYLPFDLDEVQRKLELFWSYFFDLDTFTDYLIFLTDSLNKIVIFLNLAVCAFLLVYIIYSSYADKHVVPEPKKKRVNWLRKLWRRFYICCRKGYFAVEDYIEYIGTHKFVSTSFWIVTLVNTNVLTILIGTFAYYFYFIVEFDILSLFVQVVKLLFDVIIAGWTLPGLLWIVILYCGWDWWRSCRALDEMRHLESKNRGFINSLSTVIMLTGSMGTGKTRMAVDMALSLEQQFRADALKLMNRNIFRFPKFDFIRFQKALTEQIKEGNLKNWDSCRRWVRSCHATYKENPCSENIFGYDVEKYPTVYYDDLKAYDIWEMMENYAQEYFLYISVSSLIIANLSIRSDVDQICSDYFPRWRGDFFDRDVKKQKQYSEYAHIIDFDLFRLGCQMNQENNIAGAFEFGVIVITEIGKERGNNLENKEMKKQANEANQKNDMFNAWMKLLRHAGTVEGVCFVRLICDEQRATSWGADARDTATVVNIKGVSEPGTTLSYNILPYLFMNKILPSYSSYYNRVMNYGNTTAKPISWLHNAFCLAYARSDRKINRYAAMVATVSKEDGDLEGEAELHEYYLMPKKIYSKRYSTDCYKEYFADRAKKSEYSFIHSQSYQSDVATLQELEQQRSYLISGLSDMMKKI